MTKSRRKVARNNIWRYYLEMSEEAPKDPKLLKNTERFPSGHGYPVERLQTLKLKNEVIWVNKNLSFPFALSEGQKDVDVGLFLDIENRKIPEDNHPLGVRWGHGRSADIGKVFFRDTNRPDLVYRDIDIKGSGDVAGSVHSTGERLQSQHWRERKNPANSRGTGEYSGLLQQGAALHDSEIAENLTEMGIRTHRSLAVIKLNELPLLNSTGDLAIVPIEELVRAGVLRNNFEPALQLRAFGIKTRLIDFVTKDAFAGFGDDTEVRNMIDDALSFVRYITKGDVGDVKGYLKWFANTLGTNVGLLEKSGSAHRFLGSQNITLDSSIVDFDSVGSAGLRRARDDRGNDFYEAKTAFINFATKVLDRYSIEAETNPEEPIKRELKDAFNRAYHTNLP